MDNTAQTASKLSKMLSSLTKYLKALLQLIKKYSPVLFAKTKFYIIKFVKSAVKYISSLRIGVRPEFKRWLDNLGHGGGKNLFKGLSLSTLVYFIRRKALRGAIKHKRMAARVVAAALPVFFALFIFKYISPISAQLLSYDERLNAYVASSSLEVGIDKDQNKSDQVYYVFEKNKTYVTDSNNAKGAVVTDREDISWMESVDGYWQIFLYHIPTKKLIQLTYTGNNVNPKIYNGKIVWEGIRVDGVWQVYLYDGTSIGPISSGDASLGPDINGNFVVFSRKDVNGQWRSTAYSINDRKEVDIDFGPEDQHVVLKGKDILIGYGGKAKKFKLNVEDLMILNLGALSPQSSTTLESIQNEINQLVQNQ